MRQLRGQGKWIGVIAAFGVLAAASATWVLTEQKVVTPLAERYVIRAEMSNTSGLEPGLGQPVNVAGVRVGSITKAELRDGRSIIDLEIDPDHLPRVYDNARANLVPNTPLQDLGIELYPGGPPARPLPDRGLIPVSRTAPPLHLDEFLSVLDRDTRDYIKVLIGEVDRATRNRGRDLRNLLRTLRPTGRQLRSVNEALADRHESLRGTVDGLERVTRAMAGADRELASTVAGAAATVRALAGRERELREAVRRLPGTLAAARAVVGHTELTRELRPALDALLPVARRLPGALRAARPLLARAEPLVREQLRPLAKEALPALRDADPATRDLHAVTPSLEAAFKTLQYLVNELGHNPAGRADEGYLFWLAWFAHNFNSTLSSADAHGSVFRGYYVFNCDVFKQQSGLSAEFRPFVDIFPGCQ